VGKRGKAFIDCVLFRVGCCGWLFLIVILLFGVMKWPRYCCYLFIVRYVTNRCIENNFFVKEIGYSNIEQCCK